MGVEESHHREGEEKLLYGGYIGSNLEDDV